MLSANSAQLFAHGMLHHDNLENIIDHEKLKYKDDSPSAIDKTGRKGKKQNPGPTNLRCTRFDNMETDSQAPYMIDRQI